MNRSVRSRTESRKERKLVLLLLLVVIGVGLGCFALGVMVGRSAAPQAVISQEEAPAAARLPVPAAAPTNPPATAQDRAAPADAAANLTFYENLPRGEQPPLGSGINLPPGAPAPAAAAPGSPTSPPPAPAVATAPQKPAPPAAAPKSAPSAGSYLIQAASFPGPDDAGVLQARLAKKGLKSYVRQADLGPKGVWYRVFVGPVASAAEAEQVAARLKSEEKLSPLVRKR